MPRFPLLRAHDTKKTIDHAARLIDLFSANGIPKYVIIFDLSWGDQKLFYRGRVCIKIPSTVEALIACSDLENGYPNTRNLSIFRSPGARSIPGGVYSHFSVNERCVCSLLQWMTLINGIELRANFDKTLYKEYASSVTKHPGIRTIQSILEAYTKIQSRRWPGRSFFLSHRRVD